MKILIVEDSKFVQNITRKLVTERFPEAEVLTATNGEDGYALYREHAPDIVLSDLLMPGMSGQELLRAIRADDAKTKVIVISADVQKATRDEIEAMGISGFVSKPVTGERAELLATLIAEAATC